MPFALIFGLVSLAISAYSVVQGIRTDNKAMVMGGMLGAFAGIGGLAASGIGAGIGAASQTATAGTGAVTGGLGVTTTTGTGASNFASLASRTAAAPTLASATAPTINQAGLASLGSIGGATEGVVNAGILTGAEQGLQLGGAGELTKEVSTLGKIKDGLGKAGEWASDNSELIKGASSIYKGYAQNKANNEYLDRVDEENDRRRAKEALADSRGNAVPGANTVKTYTSQGGGGSRV